MSEYAFVGSELLYSDPPYLRHTRTSKHRYRFDYEEADHVELLELLKGGALSGDGLRVSLGAVRGAP